MSEWPPLAAPVDDRSRGGCGCCSLRAAAAVFVGFLVLWQAYAWVSWYQDRQLMKRELHALGFDSWVDLTQVDVEISHVFTGSDTYYFRAPVLPADMGRFLAVVDAGSKRFGPTTQPSGWIGSQASSSWWRPSQDPELRATRWQGGESLPGATWYIGVSIKQGAVYIEREGH